MEGTETPGLTPRRYAAAGLVPRLLLINIKRAHASNTIDPRRYAAAGLLEV